jgi:CHASE3 domain sensor protein
MKTLKRIFKKRATIIALYGIIALILIDTLFTFNYKRALNRNVEEQKVMDELLRNKERIISNLNTMDMSLRGYLLVGNEAFADTYTRTRDQSGPQMTHLEENLHLIDLPKSVLSEMISKQKNYFELMDGLIELERAGNHEEALAILKADHGTPVWMTYVELSKIIDPKINERKTASENNYNDLLNLNLYFQFILFLVGIPTLIYTSVRLLKDERRRTNLYKQLDASNRNLIFDTGTQIDIENEKAVIGEMINNLSKTSDFIKGIANGNLDVTWENHNAFGSNQQNISGQLMHMRDQMKKKQLETQKEQWINEGENKFNNLIREHQQDFKVLADKALSFIVAYLKSQQGSLFIVTEDEAGQKFLELSSAYAYNRKKYLQKRIAPGDGLVGQTYMEAEPVYLVDVPQDYVTITSGLGESNPGCITIHPLKQENEVVAVIEIASFKPLDKSAVTFLSNCCRTLAATILGMQTSEKTRLLLEKTQQQAEMMRAQEEEMRQNMEELEATQEEMKRRESELRALLEQQAVTVQQTT